MHVGIVRSRTSTYLAEKMRIPGIVERDGDGSTRLVALAAVAALLLGAIFLVCAIPDVRPKATAQPVPATPSKAPPPGKGAEGATSSGQGAAGVAAATGKPSATQQQATAGKPAATVKPAPTVKPANASGGGSTAGQLPAATGSAEPVKPAAAGLPIFPEDRETRNAARWAALLWAFACCAVGAFLGFIFGIPRSLSSDTARTTVPLSARASDAAKAKTAALKAAAVKAAADRDKATAEANDAAAALSRAAAELNELRAAAGQEADSDARVRAAMQAHAGLVLKKTNLDKIASEKARAAEDAEEQAKKDGETSAASGAPSTATFSQPQNSRGPSTAVNTNLEQISDWLTKIIVGVSLVNSEKIGTALVTASKEMARSFGGEPASSLALAMLTYFGVIGLLGGYLLTRLYLQRAFEAAGSYDMAAHRPG
jgi:hypothetical protein